MSENKYYTLMLIPDGTQKRKGFKIRQWLLKMIAGLFIILVVGILLFFIFYGSVLNRALKADELEKENSRLKNYQYKVQLLEENLNQARAIVTRLTELAGIDITFPELPPDSTLFASIANRQNGITTRQISNDFSLPSGLPITGFISQDFEIEDGKHFHPGIDIACAEGLPVLATASGNVVYADFDSTYGYMVVVQHNDSITSVYGHNKQLLVERGEDILAGSRVALSGNTGKSTAPHVHYEVRIHNKPINPLDYPYDKKTK